MPVIDDRVYNSIKDSLRTAPSLPPSSTSVFLKVDNSDKDAPVITADGVAEDDQELALRVVLERDATSTTVCEAYARLPLIDSEVILNISTQAGWLANRDFVFGPSEAMNMAYMAQVQRSNRQGYELQKWVETLRETNKTVGAWMTKGQKDLSKWIVNWNSSDRSLQITNAAATWFCLQAKDVVVTGM
jgi:hypothetical protein